MPKEIVRYTKKHINKVALALILYELIFQEGAFLLFVYGPDFIRNAYLIMILTSAVAILSSFLILGKIREPNTQYERFTLTKYIYLIFVLYGVQFVASLLTAPIQEFLQEMGNSLEYAEQAATGGNIFDPLEVSYSIIFAPLFEELLYRGLVYGELRRFGRYFAIFTSALLFGMMHGNIIQLIFAFLTGFLLASIRERYGLVYAILIHMSNNLFASLIVSFSEYSITAVLSSILMLGGTTVFFFSFIKGLPRWLGELKKERSFPYMLGYFFTSIFMLIFLLILCYLTATNLD